nr:unnamed protein product [Spirometra erinaceieuropaei]
MDIDTQELTRKKRSLQKAFHPDRLTRLVKDEQVIAADLSAKINEAYKILVDPISRAEYILSLQGGSTPEKEAESVDKDFLIEIMELSEKLEEMTLVAKVSKSPSIEFTVPTACSDDDNSPPAHTNRDQAKITP